MESAEDHAATHPGEDPESKKGPPFFNLLEETKDGLNTVLLLTVVNINCFLYGIHININFSHHVPASRPRHECESRKDLAII